MEIKVIDPRTPCLIGVGHQTWHPDQVGVEGAPEPLAMWEIVTRLAATDSGAARVLDSIDSVDVVYCQTWQYDNSPARLAEKLKINPTRSEYSGIGGTTPQVLLQNAAARILTGKSNSALIVGAEALATKRMFKKNGAVPSYSFPPTDKRPFPWEAPFNSSELAHECVQAWLTFSLFDNARRAARGINLDDYRTELGNIFAPMTKIAAGNPDAWFRTARSVEEIVKPSSDNRMVGYPYTKYMISVMDVDMAAALLLTSHEQADALGVPAAHRVYLRGWCYATDPIYVAEHADLAQSPAMAAAAHEALRVAKIDADDVAHLDLYSCFGSSVNFARDVLKISFEDSRPLSVTGGLPYHGGAGSNYMTHSIAAMVEKLRNDSGSYGLVTGVGMHMTKHVYGIYSTEPGKIEPPNQKSIQSQLNAQPQHNIIESYDGEATVTSYSVIHNRDGEVDKAVLICDVKDGRAYAVLNDHGACRAAEKTELIGQTVRLSSQKVDLSTGEKSFRHYAELSV